MGASQLPALPWCIVMSDTRDGPSEAHVTKSPLWHQTVHVNRMFVIKHGYGFVHVQWRPPRYTPRELADTVEFQCADALDVDYTLR